jgi:hypothetical protein
VEVDVLSVLAADGVLLESAHGPIANVAELVAGEPISGSWWAHRASHAIYAAINAVADSPDVVRLRLVNGKVTLVHRRVWPALVRVSRHFSAGRLAAIREEHTSTGAHRKIETAFPDWVPADVMAAAVRLSEPAAFAQLPDCLRPARSQ